MTPPDPAGSAPASNEITQALLTIAYPAFRFSHLMTGWHHSHWVAVRKNPADPGLHTIITADLDELQAELGPAGPLPRRSEHDQTGDH